MKKPFFAGNPLEILEPGIPKAKELLEKGKLELTDENIFIAGALATAGGNKGIDFLHGKVPVNVRKIAEKAEKPKPASPPSPVSTPINKPETSHYVITVEDRAYKVSVKESTEEISSIAPLPLPKKGKAVQSSAESMEVTAQLPGNVYRINVSAGDIVKADDVLLVLEAMKMETEVIAPASGKIAAVHVQQGNVVEAGQLLVTVVRQD